MGKNTFERYVNATCLLSMKGLFLVFSLTCLAVGIYFIDLANSGHRSAEVELYDASVSEWTSSGRSEFEGLIVTVNNGTEVMKLVTDTGPDELHDQDVDHDLLQYQTLKYSFTGPLFGEVTWDQTEGQFTSSVTFTIEQAGKTSTVELPVTVYRTKIYPASNQKNCRYQIHGSWLGAHCQTFHRLTRVCLQVNQTASGLWQADTSLGGAGCTEYDHWNTDEFQVLKGTHVSFSHGEPPEGEIIGMNQIEVMLRSSQDPFIDAMTRTHDSGNFGDTSHDEYVVGGVLFGAAVVLAVPLFAHCYTVNQVMKQELLSRVNLHDKQEGEWAELNNMRGQDAQDNL